ncbi:unnamed protein product [Schistosoma margrebowiei]|uniref:Uncharacterized protein n=1 Tax=Schistosoma margrebowiei TaxID=48269 RepID=A0A183MPD4_9TREM|nr:unnamed protein product [Schistosoma margrebowiei]
MKSPYFIFYNEIVDKALDFWQNALSVKRPSNRNLLIRRLWLFPSKNQSLDTVCEHACDPSVKCHTMQVPANFLQVSL